MGYGVSFYMFPKCLAKYTLSTAYTLWCGFGIVFTSINRSRHISRDYCAKKNGWIYNHNNGNISISLNIIMIIIIIIESFRIRARL